MKRLPWGANEAILEALFDRMGTEQILARCTPKLDYLQLCASGSYGLIQSALNDGLVLPAYARTGVYEPRMPAMFRDFFASHGGGTYLDIRANIGLTTIPVAQDDPTVRCLAFEPDPVNSRHLRANVERNCPNHNVTVHQVTLFSSKSTLDFAVHEWNLGDHRLSPAQHGSGQMIQVEAAPLDQFDNEVTARLPPRSTPREPNQSSSPAVARCCPPPALSSSSFPPTTCTSSTATQVSCSSSWRHLNRSLSALSGDALPTFHRPAEALVQLKKLLSEWCIGDPGYYDVFATRGYLVGQPATP